MEIQELFVTFLFVLIALFLQELARRITQPLSRLLQPNNPVAYFDFVRNSLFYPHTEIGSVIAFALVYLASYLLWLPWVLIYVLSIPKIAITQLSIINFPYFMIHFWTMFFIALTVFLPYWGFGWFSFYIYERRVNREKNPYPELASKKDERDHHRKHFGKYRIIPWLFFFALSLVLYYAGLHLSPI